MAHEKSITVGVDGKFYNVPSIVNGKKVSTKAAVDSAFKSKKMGRGYATKDTAIAAAKKRSASFDKKHSHAKPRKK